MNLSEIKAQIVSCCHRMWNRGYVANHDGNISYKISPNLYIATPTSFSKLDIKEDDLILIDDQGQVKEGKHKVFSEISWHMAIYSARADVSCVVHGHPPVAMGMGLAHYELGTPSVPEAIVSLGRGIFSLSQNNPALTGEIKKVLKDSDAFLVPGNGAWTVGQNVLQTYLRLELVEQLASAHMYAKNFGGAKPLPRSLVEELLKKRPQPSQATPTADKNNYSVSATTNDHYSAVRKLVETEVVKLLTTK